MTEIFTDFFMTKLFQKVEVELKNSENLSTKEKSDLMTKTLHQAIIEYMSDVNTFTVEEFDKLLDKQKDSLTRISDAVQKEMLNSMRTNPEVDINTISFLALFFNSEQNMDEKIESKLDEIISNKETLRRLFVLELLGKFEFFILLMLITMSNSRLYQLGTIIEKRFDSNINWTLSVATLATHENLIKKKLTELGTSEDEIEKIVKEKKFGGLVEHLEKQILEKENRTMSLSFHKSSALRAMRNELEHNGFKLKITDKEIDNLLYDIEQFDKELFPENPANNKRELT